MSTPFDPREVLTRNTQLDPSMLEEIEEMRRQLREMNVPKKGYQILPPFGIRRGRPDPSPRVDPRAVRLRRSADG